MDSKEKLRDKILVAAIETITSGKQSNDLFKKGLDVAVAGRMFLKKARLVLGGGTGSRDQRRESDTLGLEWPTRVPKKAIDTVGSAGWKLGLAS